MYPFLSVPLERAHPETRKQFCFISRAREREREPLCSEGWSTLQGPALAQGINDPLILRPYRNVPDPALQVLPGSESGPIPPVERRASLCQSL